MPGIAGAGGITPGGGGAFGAAGAAGADGAPAGFSRNSPIRCCPQAWQLSGGVGRRTSTPQFAHTKVFMVPLRQFFSDLLCRDIRLGIHLAVLTQHTPSENVTDFDASVSGIVSRQIIPVSDLDDLDPICDTGLL